MAVRVELSESNHIDVSPNQYLNALSSGKFASSSLASYKTFVMARPATATASGLTIEHASAILSASLATEIGRTGGVYPVPANKRDQEEILRAVIAKDSDKKKKTGADTTGPTVKKISPLAKFNSLFNDYIVSLFRIPPELIMARKVNSAEVQEAYRGKGKDPHYDAGKVQLFLMKLATGDEETRAQWLANTILPEKVAKRYLRYLDNRVAEINAKFTRSNVEAEAVEKAEAATKALQIKVNKVNKVFSALAKDDATRPAKKAELKALVEKYNQAEAEADEAREALEKRKAELAAADAKAVDTEKAQKILVHQLLVGDWAVAIDRSQVDTTKDTKKKKSGGGGSDDEEEEEDEEDDADSGMNSEKNSVPPAKASTTRIPDGGITLDNVELLPFNMVLRIQAAVHDIYRTKNNDKGISDPAQVKLFDLYGTLRNSTTYSKKSSAKSTKTSVFPDAYTLAYEPLLHRTARSESTPPDLFQVPRCDAYFPVFSIRTLIANYVALINLRSVALATKKSGSTAAKTTSEGTHKPAPKKKGSVQIDISESDVGKKSSSSSSASSSSSSEDDDDGDGADEEKDDDSNHTKAKIDKKADPALLAKKKKEEEAAAAKLKEEEAAAAEAAAKKKKKEEEAAAAKKEAAKKKKADEEAAAKKEADEEAAKKKKEEETATAKKEAAKKKKAAEEAAEKKKKEEEEEAAKKKKEEEAAAKEAAKKKKKAEEEAAKKKKVDEEEAAKKKKAEEEAAASKKAITKKKTGKETPSKHVVGVLELSLSKDASSDSELDEIIAAGTKKGSKRKVDDDSAIKSVSEERNHKSKKSKKETPAQEPIAPVATVKKAGAKASTAASSSIEVEKPQPSKKRPATAIDLSSDGDDADKQESAEKAKKPPTKKAREDDTKKAAASAKPAADEIVFDSDEIGDVLIQNFLRYGSWKLSDIVDSRDIDVVKSTQEEANALLAASQTANFHDHGLDFTSMPTGDELDAAHRTLAIPDEPRSMATLFKAAFTARHAEKMPLIIADSIINKAAVIEADYEHTAHDYVTSDAGHLDLASTFAVTVGAIDLVLRSCNAATYKVPTLVETLA